MISRWISVAALVYAGWVLYALGVGLAMDRLDPAISARLDFFLIGSVAGALFAPATAFFIVRAVNRSAESERDDERWWWRSHRLVAGGWLAAVVIALLGALIGWLAGSLASGVLLGGAFGALLTLAPSRPSPGS